MYRSYNFFSPSATDDKVAMDGVAVPGKLKLKKDGAVKKKKKSSKSELREQFGAFVRASIHNEKKTGNSAAVPDPKLLVKGKEEEKDSGNPRSMAPRKTKAEMAFQGRQDALQVGFQ